MAGCPHFEHQCPRSSVPQFSQFNSGGGASLGRRRRLNKPRCCSKAEIAPSPRMILAGSSDIDCNFREARPRRPCRTRKAVRVLTPYPEGMRSRFMKTIRASLVIISMVAAMAANSVRADQPHMRRALEHLRAARAELRSAEHDKGGW